MVGTMGCEGTAGNVTSIGSPDAGVKLWPILCTIGTVRSVDITVAMAAILGGALSTSELILAAMPPESQYVSH